MTTIDCKDIAALLSGLVDGEIEGDERHHAERHLAECDSCREKLDEAEALDRLLASDAAMLEELPTGFMDEVLARTTRAGMARRTLGSRWLAIGGWLAAAASLTLAFGFWVSDNQTSSRQDNTIAGNRDAGSGGGSGWNTNSNQTLAKAGGTYHNVPRRGSMTFDAAIPLETYQGLTALADATPGSETTAGAVVNAVNPQFRPTIDNGTMDFVSRPAGMSNQGGELQHLFNRWRSDLWSRAMTSPGASMEARTPTVLEPRVAERMPLSRNDAETLRAATTLLEMLMDADHQSFRDVERIRRIAENDSLIARIGDTRSRLAAMDRPAILAVESIVHRIVYGPVSLGDLSVMAKTVADLNLIGQLDTMTGRWDPRSSL